MFNQGASRSVRKSGDPARNAPLQFGKVLWAKLEGWQALHHSLKMQQLTNQYSWHQQWYNERSACEMSLSGFRNLSNGLLSCLTWHHSCHPLSESYKAWFFVRKWQFQLSNTLHQKHNKQGEDVRNPSNVERSMTLMLAWVVVITPQKGKG